VSRQAVRALAGHVTENGVEVWALDGGPPSGKDRVNVRAFRSAAGGRARLLRWTMARALRPCDRLTVVVMHLHLAPLAAAPACRGARAAVFLHGIEAWRRLRPRERYALGAADLIMANSRRTAERFVSANPAFALERVGVCPLGVSDRAASAAPAPADRAD